MGHTKFLVTIITVGYVPEYSNHPNYVCVNKSIYCPPLTPSFSFSCTKWFTC